MGSAAEGRDGDGEGMSPVLRFLERLGLVVPPSARSKGVGFVVASFLRDYKNHFLQHLAKGSWVFGSTVGTHWLRPFYHRARGCRIGRGTRIAEDCILGLYHPAMITLEDGVGMAARCLLLEHKRDLSLYRRGRDILDCEMVVAPVVLRKGCFLGVGSVIMPGVTVGEGAIVGAGSVVHQDVEAYTVVQGNPACLVLRIPDAVGQPAAPRWGGGH